MTPQLQTSTAQLFGLSSILSGAIYKGDPVIPQEITLLSSECKKKQQELIEIHVLFTT